MYLSFVAKNQFKEEYARISFRFKPASVVDTKSEVFQLQLETAFKKMGWTVYTGTPPRSKRERFVRDLAQKVAKKK